MGHAGWGQDTLKAMLIGEHKGMMESYGCRGFGISGLGLSAFLSAKSGVGLQQRFRRGMGVFRYHHRF